ncbi:6995_t:CDS:1, partial [Paraglomus brasilianum]
MVTLRVTNFGGEDSYFPTAFGKYHYWQAYLYYDIGCSNQYQIGRGDRLALGE